MVDKCALSGRWHRNVIYRLRACHIWLLNSEPSANGITQPFTIFTGQRNKQVHSTLCFLEGRHHSPHDLLRKCWLLHHLPFFQAFPPNVLGTKCLQEAQGKWAETFLLGKYSRRHKHNGRLPVVNHQHNYRTIEKSSWPYFHIQREYNGIKKLIL